MIPQSLLTGEVLVAPARQLVRGQSGHRIARLCALVALCAPSAGCIVHTYQPLSGLHHPVVVDPTMPNLEGVAVTVYCVPRELLNEQSASRLCDRVGLLFENQGAVVQVRTSARTDDELEGPAEPVPQDAVAPELGLAVELRSRSLHRSDHPLTWAIYGLSFTVLPAVTEETFAIDVAIRDQDGFLLSRESLQGRRKTYIGAGSWLGYRLLDRVRRKENQVKRGDRFPKDLSEDVYGKLSQLVFDARMQAEVLARAPERR